MEKNILKRLTRSYKKEKAMGVLDETWKWWAFGYTSCAFEWNLITENKREKLNDIIEKLSYDKS